MKGGRGGAIEISTRTANQGCPRCKCLSPDVDDKGLDQLPWQGQNCSRLSRWVVGDFKEAEAGRFGWESLQNPHAGTLHVLHTPPLTGLPRPRAGEGGAGRRAGAKGTAPRWAPAGAGPAWVPGSASRAAVHSPSRAARGRGAPAASRSARAPPFALGSVGPHSLWPRTSWCLSVFSMITWQKKREAARFSSGGYVVCARFCLHVFLSLPFAK